MIISAKFKVMHVGYPVAGRKIREDEWKVYSVHKTGSAAVKAIRRAKAHLQPGQWDDHYMIVDEQGRDVTDEVYHAEEKAIGKKG